MVILSSDCPLRIDESASIFSASSLQENHSFMSCGPDLKRSLKGMKGKSFVTGKRKVVERETSSCATATTRNSFASSLHDILSFFWSFDETVATFNGEICNHFSRFPLLLHLLHGISNVKELKSNLGFLLWLHNSRKKLLPYSSSSFTFFPGNFFRLLTLILINFTLDAIYVPQSFILCL